MMKKYKSYTLIFLYSCSMLLSEEKAKVEIDTLWQHYKIKVSGNSMLEEKPHSSGRNFWREESREASMKKLSLFLESFLVDRKTRIKNILNNNPDFAREYTVFLDSLRLDRFFIKEGQSFSGMFVLLRGNRSLLSILPLSWKQLDYQDLKPSEYVGDGYLDTEIKKSFRTNLLPVRYTGLIVDVRGYGFQPSLSPRILSQNGKLVYGAEFLNPALGVQRGIVGFSKDMNSKEVARRTGERPLLAVALSVSGRFNADAIISHRDLQDLFRHPGSVKNLLKCKVIFLIDN